MTDTKVRYTDQELEEFRVLIQEKLDKAQKEYDELRSLVVNDADNSDADTAPTFKALEEGANTLGKEEAVRLAKRQADFIAKLKGALIRIDNKTYGICRVTGKLIPKERLRAVPHATLSMEAKQ
ncbi:MAG: TraR/DksA C4-type zinc finger protein [Prevotella sp.]|nr:TraR/DksA C4-type zinc finger protein [Prevotella sp.]MCM1075542.1 TraR/DksA C4-type zinc finger protein [Ruminococcus sp.]